jgi:OFA family oxalate/formate antiporter-like MFS transporter
MTSTVNYTAGREHMLFPVYLKEFLTMLMTKKTFYGWWIVGACFLIGLYKSGIVFYGFTAFIEPIKRELGWSYTQISFAASLRGLEMGVFAPLVGFLVDRFGARNLVLCGTITAGFGLILLSLTNSLATFYMAFLLLGFGSCACGGVVFMAAVANWFRRRVGIAMGIRSAGFGTSGLMVPLIVLLITLYDWRIALIILGLGMWGIGIPLSFVVRNRPEQYGYLPDGEVVNDTITEYEIQQKEVTVGFRDALKSKAFLYLNLVEAVRMMALTAVVLHIMPYLGGLGISRTTAGLVAAAIPLFSVIGRFGFGWVADLFDKRNVMAAAYLLMGTGVLILCYAKAAWAIILFLGFFSPGYGGINVLRGAILREYFGRDSFGKILGIIMGSASIGGILGPTLAGWVFDTFGTYHIIWLVLGGITCLTGGLILRVNKPLIT